MSDITISELVKQDERTWLPTLQGIQLQLELKTRLEWDTLGYIAHIDHRGVFTPEDIAEYDEEEDLIDGPVATGKPGQDASEGDDVTVPNLWE
jgi:hypothetical protein